MKRLFAVTVILLSVSAFAAPPTTKPVTKPAKPLAQGDVFRLRIDDINFADMTAQQGIDAVAAKIGSPITVDWVYLKDHGVSPDSKLRGRLADVSVRGALQHILVEMDAPTSLDVRIGSDGLRIGALAESQTVETRVYNVGPQLERIAAELTPTLPKGVKPNDIRDAAINQLIKLITQHVAPESWRDAGGTVGMLSLTGTRLSITNSRAALRDIDQYFKELDKPRGK